MYQFQDSSSSSPELQLSIFLIGLLIAHLYTCSNHLIIDFLSSFPQHLQILNLFVYLCFKFYPSIYVHSIYFTKRHPNRYTLIKSDNLVFRKLLITPSIIWVLHILHDECNAIAIFSHIFGFKVICYLPRITQVYDDKI